MNLIWLASEWRKLQKDEAGQTVVEYALMIVLVAIAIAAIFPPVQNAIAAVFTNVQNILGGGGGT